MRAPTTLAAENAPGGSPVAGFRLVVMGPNVFETHALPLGADVVIGRSDEADVPLDDARASRRHARLRVGPGGELEIEDLGSANGTRVREHRIAPGRPVALLPGEGVAIGTLVLMVRRAPTGAGTAGGSGRAKGRASPASAGGAAAGASAGTRGRPSFAGAGGPMRQLLALAERAAAGRLNVLLLGETGAGKEVLARFIHDRSPRARGPFVVVNGAALSESLLESELFGHEKGAFTGADRAKAGLLETAEGGTVLIDEVGELPAAIQAKLLRAIERREVARVGAVKPRAVDVRFLAATNRDLEADVASGRFRRDLYFRLAGFCLHIPPLRERRDEIGRLAARFAAEAARALGRPRPVRLSDAALETLVAHDWPGNVRELRQAIERAVTLADRDELEIGHLGLPAAPAGAPASPPRPASRPAGRAALDASGLAAEAERARVEAVLAACGGNQSRAARQLHMSRKALIRRLESWGAPRPRKGGGGGR